MFKRVLTAVIGLPVLVFILLQSGWVLRIAGAIVLLIAIHEFYKSMEVDGYKPIKVIGYLGTILLVLLSKESLNVVVVFLTIITSMFYYLFSSEIKVKDLAISILAFMYVPFFLVHIILTADLSLKYLVWYIFIIAWSTDTCAYFVGVFFGKHKLYEAVSPKKTIEGSIGGIIGCVLIVAIVTFFIDKTFIMHSIILGGLGSIISQIGDLVASKIKREAGIKDYGNLMPGHGGILDRFDSILVVAPLVYYYYKIMMYLI